MNKRLKLNEITIADMKNIKAGHAACWENLWTAYYCDVVYTGVRDPLPEVTNGCTFYENSQCTI